MRTIKEILEVMLENKDMFKSGLCFLAANLFTKNILNKEEYLLIDEYIDSKAPRNKKIGDYYWEHGNIKPRLRWLKKHIELNS